MRRLALVVLLGSAWGCGVLLSTTSDPPERVASADASPTDGALDAVIEPTDGADAADAAASQDAAPAPCNRAPACERVVFVSSLPYLGNDLGAQGATLCNNLAASTAARPRVRGRTFLPLIAFDDGVHNVKGTGAYVRPDGMRIAIDYGHLFAANLENAMNQDETGNVVSGVYVWTGMQGDGTADQTANCESWKTANPLAKGVIGDPQRLDLGWLRKSQPYCSGPPGNRVYCVED